jgi:quinolinate synthase
MESIVNGHVVNEITVDKRVAEYSKLALEQMLAL